ncbi:hypothetical protein [Nocardioides yefusunii]|uniref:Uncharacterized protein n=1 Tax=Nocardioides yefusunii TaxID=2500546 RepID=A0ABW1QVV5_9ACTN|nr:hypothetical protein [Nocardioides yefusunii]
MTSVAFECDFCRVPVLRPSGLMPEGWKHDMGGHDHCTECLDDRCASCEGDGTTECVARS